MGTQSFLIGSSATSFANINEAIEELCDASESFVRRFSRNEMDRAGKISEKAFDCFDHISNELLRIRDGKKRDGTYIGSNFESKLSIIAALTVRPVSQSEQIAVHTVGPGNGRLPVRGTPPKQISLERALNKIKHRHRSYLNFRIDNGRHIFVICCHDPDDITEFDVINFCDLCRDATSVL